MVLEGFTETLLIDQGSADVLTTAMWFLFALVVLVVFRKPVSSLIRQVEEVRFRDLEIDTDAVDQAASGYQTNREDRMDYESLAEKTPRYAIREGWAVLEGALADLPASSDLQTFGSRLRRLEDEGVLDEADMAAFDALRSAVAHVKEPGTTRVDTADATRLARCGVGLASRLADLDEAEVREALS